MENEWENEMLEKWKRQGDEDGPDCTGTIA